MEEELEEKLEKVRPQLEKHMKQPESATAATKHHQVHLRRQVVIFFLFLL